MKTIFRKSAFIILFGFVITGILGIWKLIDSDTFEKLFLTLSVLLVLFCLLLPFKNYIE